MSTINFNNTNGKINFNNISGYIKFNKAPIKEWIQVFTTTYDLLVQKTVSSGPVFISQAKTDLESTHPAANYAIGYEVKLEYYAETFPPNLIETFYLEVAYKV